MKKIASTLLLVLVWLCCLAQYTVKGKVINQTDTRPVAGANVFISGATIGGHTGDDGAFTLTNIKPGRYELVISVVGFDTFTEPVSVGEKDAELTVITLSPKTIALSEVKIKARDNVLRGRNYDWFKAEFLGETDMARECKILNPELLDLEYNGNTGILKASSVDFLIIENRALGYRLKYLLQHFYVSDGEAGPKTLSYDGNVLFEQMTGSPAEEKEWKARRAEVYEGSQLHFLRAALSNRLEQEGFRVLRFARTPNPQRPPDTVISKKISAFRLLAGGKDGKNYKDSLNYWLKKGRLPMFTQQRLLNTPLLRNDFIKPTDQPGLFALTPGETDGLYIDYNRYHHFSSAAITHLSDRDNTYATFVNFTMPAFFDANGAVINPLSMSYEGVWARDRIAAMIPVDYEPEAGSIVAPDTALINKIDSKVSAYAATHPDEKVYLHFDKPYYAAGDTIYYSAYITEGGLHKPLADNTILHTEFIGPDDKMSMSQQSLIKDGTAWGDFAMPDTLKGGNYRIRAYTRMMRNNSEPKYFEQNITVSSLSAAHIPESGASMPPAKKGKPVTSFLPEGGSLVAGVKSKIAFKALAGNGLGIDVKGTVVDEDDKQVAQFASSRLGMGYFYINPAAGKNYRARLHYADNSEEIINLPPALPDGIAMEVTGDDRAYTIGINCSKAWYQLNKNKLFTLMAYQGTVSTSITCKLDKAGITAVLPKKALHTGIVKVTLFSPEAEPLCERLLFVQNNDLPKLNLTTDKSSYTARERINLQLNAGNGGQPFSGHYSVAVTDEGKVNYEGYNQPTILNNLLLTSELRGYVEQPDYYFSRIDEKAAADLDLVMLTHGYRSFEWKQVLQNLNTPPAFKAETGLVISGFVKKNNKPLPGAKVKLFGKGADAMMLDTTADANGRFVFDNLGFSDNARFVIQARSATGDKEVEVEPDKPLAGPAIPAAFIPATANDEAAQLAYVENGRQFKAEQKKYGINEHTEMLKEVTIKDKKIDPFEHSQNLNGKGVADQVITADWLENSGYTNLFDAVRAKATGITFVLKTHMLISNRSVLGEFMQVIVDGMPISNEDYLKDFESDPLSTIHRGPLDDFDASQVESVEIILGAHGGAIYGSQAAGGLIIVTTKRASPINNYFKEAPGVIVYKPQGFYKARQFYSPQYDNPHTNQKMADLRSTIYWNPNIITDKDGKASFSYFNADSKGTYRVVIEGIDADGNLGRQVLRYKVE